MHAHYIARTGLGEAAPERGPHFLEHTIGMLTILSLQQPCRVFSRGLGFLICEMEQVRSALCALSTRMVLDSFLGTGNVTRGKTSFVLARRGMSPWGITRDIPRGVTTLSSSPALSGQHKTCPFLSLDLRPSQSYLALGFFSILVAHLEAVKWNSEARGLQQPPDRGSHPALLSQPIWSCDR